MKKGISLEKLISIFAGKKVIVESTSSDGLNPRANSKETGNCKTFHKIGSDVDLELKNGNRYGLTPEILTENSVEGNVNCLIALRRKITLA